MAVLVDPGYDMASGNKETKSSIKHLPFRPDSTPLLCMYAEDTVQPELAYKAQQTDTMT